MIAVDTGNDVPICDSCGHRHILGVRCSICGHVGKSQIFTKMRAKATERRMPRVGFVNGADLNTAASSGKLQSLYQIAVQVRNKALEQRSLSPGDDSDNIVDKAASHIVCFVGDSPTAVCRWSIHQHAHKEYTLLIDRILVLRDYTQKKTAYKCLYNALYVAYQQQLPLQHVDIYVPMLEESQWVVQKLQSFGFVVGNQVSNNWHGLNSVHLRLVLRSIHNNTAPSIDELLGFLLQRISV